MTMFSFIFDMPWPTSLRTWGVLMVLGIVGFSMEYLLTAGLGSDGSAGATVMIYSQVLWALLIDWLIWNLSINWLTIVGCAGVVMSLAVSSLVKELQRPSKVAGMYIDAEMSEIECELDEEYAAQISLN
jgi:drug/metabolite transporter (DMT)-like permease